MFRVASKFVNVIMNVRCSLVSSMSSKISAFESSHLSRETSHVLNVTSQFPLCGCERLERGRRHVEANGNPQPCPRSTICPVFYYNTKPSSKTDTTDDKPYTLAQATLKLNTNDSQE